MGRFLAEGAEMVLRMLGIRWANENGWLPILLVGGGALAVFAGIAWIVGRMTEPPGGDYEDAATLARGGCLTVVIGGAAIIFCAAVLWAWRYLFGY